MSRWQCRPALQVFLWSRAAIWAATILAFLWFEPKPPPLQHRWDSPYLHDLGWLTDVWARWDSRWFVQIAEHAYSSSQTAAFFPLYPGAVAVLGRVLLSHYVLAGIAVSLAACAGSFVLFHRLAERRLGLEGAQRALVYLAIFPTALFLQAVYSESLFLLLVLAAFTFAESDRWVWAGVATGLALLTRSAGVALLPALAAVGWPHGRRIAWLGLAPALFLLYPLGLWWKLGDPFAFLDSQQLWHRHLSSIGPLGGIGSGLRAGYHGMMALAGRGDAARWTVAGAEPMHAAAVNLQSLAFLGLFVWLAVVVWRRFGVPYGIFTVVSLAIPLSFPSGRWPLLSLPRFGVTIFPLFLALAVLGERPRVHSAIVGVSAMLLGLAIVQWALYQWVA